MDPSALGVEPGVDGVLASQHLRRAIDQRVIEGAQLDAVQPASIDLHLGDVAYRIRCSFLPDALPVEVKLKDLTLDRIDLTEGAVLETNRPYLIPLQESLDLPAWLRARANPKSSTGRLDVFTRVITDHSHRFDEIAAGYRGRLYLEVVPLSFTVRVRAGLALNQLRLMTGSSLLLSDDEIRALHAREPLLARGLEVVSDADFDTGNGLFVGLDLRYGEDRRVGWRAKDHTQVLEMYREGAFDPNTYWEPVYAEPGDRIVLDPERFYLLLSDESVRIPPEYAAEMTAYDPTSGELRTHYAGFFDPGFGHDPNSEFIGSRAALEVRAHDVPFMVEHGQKVCKLTFEKMLEVPDRLYGGAIGSSYQQQLDTLSKHFMRPVDGRRAAHHPDQADLFDQ